MDGATLLYDFSGVNALAKRVAKIGELDRFRLLDAVGATVESQTRRRIGEDKEGPDGAPWPDWSDRYAKSRHGNQSLLESEGYLLASLGYAVSLGAGQVEVGSNLVYAATQQFGDDKRNIPERPYLGLSSDDEDEVDAVVRDFLLKVLP